MSIEYYAETKEIFLNGTITQDSVEEFRDALNKHTLKIKELTKDLEADDAHAFDSSLLLVINSQGGSVISTISIIDLMDSYEHKINTHVCGSCHSSAYALWLSGHKKTATQNSLFIHHDTSTSLGNDTFTMLSNKLELIREMCKPLEDIILANTTFTEDEVKDIYERKLDYYFRRDEAIERCLYPNTKGYIGEDSNPSVIKKFFAKVKNIL